MRSWSAIVRVDVVFVAAMFAIAGPSCRKPSVAAGPVGDPSAAAPSASPSALVPVPAVPASAKTTASADRCRIEGGRQPTLARFGAADERALAAAMGRGIAVVAADDCHGLRLLPGCSAHGHYGYLGITPKTTPLDLATDEELRVNAPMPTAKPGGPAPVHADITVVGERGTTRDLVGPDELTGSCEGATHFVRSAEVGLIAPHGGKARTPPACAGAHPLDETTKGCDALVEVRLSLIAPLGALIAFDQSPAGTVANIGTCPSSLVVSLGRCVRPPTKDPYLCAYGDAAECQRECDRGDANSCDVLGFMLSHRSGAERDVTAAVPVYDKSCGIGDSIACDNLGSFYFAGDGVAKDATKAVTYFGRACDFGSVEGCGSLATLVRSGQGTAADVPRGLSLLGRACDAGSLGGCMTLAALDLDADAGTGASRERGAATLARLCDEDNGRACLEWGRRLFLGEGMPSDRTRAVPIFEKGCRAGDDSACVTLGLLYRQAQGVARDDVLATRLMDRACGHGFAEGCLNLGIAYENGKGIAVNLPRAAELYGGACDAGVGKACVFLGDLLHTGTGVAKDETKARAAYQRGCERGEQEGCGKGQ